jgi:hypothetical protein
MRSLVFKETTTNGESRLKQRNLDIILFFKHVRVKEKRMIFLCKRSGGNSEIAETKSKRHGVYASGMRTNQVSADVKVGATRFYSCFH